MINWAGAPTQQNCTARPYAKQYAICQICPQNVMANFWDVTHALWWHVCHTPMCIIAIMAREAWWVAAKRASQLRFYSQWKLQNATSCRMPYTAQCTMHNAHVIIPITCTHWQLYSCCCESGHFCQLNCVAVGDGADYGSCWVWRGGKKGGRRVSNCYNTVLR